MPPSLNYAVLIFLFHDVVSSIPKISVLMCTQCGIILCAIKTQSPCHIPRDGIPALQLPRGLIYPLCIHFPNCKMGLLRVPSSQEWCED